MNLEQGTERGTGTRANLTSGSEFLEKARPLFVCGCARSGTTAFANYMNQQQEILLCEERYKGRQRRVTWDMFTFERIMDFRPEETKRPPLGRSPEGFAKRHEEILSKKDPEKLKWLGDKGPFYVRHMDLLAGQNPGARFIVLYRPLEEVAESWEARAKNPDDPWRSERDFKMSVEIWNAAMQKTREFIESSPAPRALLVDYHDFFSSRNEAVVPQISRFLGIEFDESVTRTWAEETRKFESERRRKDALDEEQLSFIREHADRDSEAWVLERIERQWTEPGLYVEESKEAALASLDRIEAMNWKLRQRVEKLEQELASERRLREVQGSQKNQPAAKSEPPEEAQPATKTKPAAKGEPGAESRRLERRVRNLERQLESIHASRAWKLMQAMHNLKGRVQRLGRGSSR